MSDESSSISEAGLSTPRRTIAVCCTVRNAASDCVQLVADLEAQVTSFDFKAVIVDGASTDQTLSTLRRLAASSKVELEIDELAGNISAGRNRAIEIAGTDVVVTVDAGTRLPPNWLEQLAGPVLAGQSCFTAGFFVPPPDATGWHAAISASIVPYETEFRREEVLPSARATAFLREDWALLGGYPEFLDHTEDLVFYQNLKELRGAPRWIFEAAVVWDTRDSLRSFYRQYRLYARGDAIAGIYSRRHAVRYSFYLAILGAWIFGPRVGLIVSTTGLILAIRRPIRRMGSHVATRDWPLARKLAYALAVQVCGDAGKMAGYIQGRLRGRAYSGLR